MVCSYCQQLCLHQLPMQAPWQQPAPDDNNKEAGGFAGLLLQGMPLLESLAQAHGVRCGILRIGRQAGSCNGIQLSSLLERICFVCNSSLWLSATSAELEPDAFDACSICCTGRSQVHWITADHVSSCAVHCELPTAQSYTGALHASAVYLPNGIPSQIILLAQTCHI